MSTIECGRCGATTPSSEASYSSDGLVCSRCHLNDQLADEEQMRAASEGGTDPIAGLGLGGPALSFTSRRVETRHADGSVTVHESSEVDGWAARFFKAIFKQ